MAPAFNPIDYSSALEAVGVTKAQAAVHAKALSSVLVDVAFAHDLTKLETNLRNEILQCEERLSMRIDSVRTELSAKIMEANCNTERLRTETNSRFDAMRTELVIHRWALGISMAMNATTLALVTKLLLA
jgi:hypothetical protein